MGEKIVVGPINKGLRTDREPFVIDNDSFPTLVNAYQWRGRVKRKRGTSTLTRLKRFFNSSNPSYFPAPGTIILSGGSANLFTGFSLQSFGSIIPTSVVITDTISGNVYTDPAGDGILVGAPAGSGTINYASGEVTIIAGGADTIAAQFLYYPDLPVMGLEDLNLTATQFPGSIAFDTTYSYGIQTTSPYDSYDVSFYKNPTTATFPGYTQKTNATPLKWNGNTYQQFWSTNYQGSMWATNGIAIPFDISKIGMQYKSIVSVTVTAGGPPATATLNIPGHGLVVGDFLFINEVTTTTGINFQTGYVIAVIDANNVSVEFPDATIAANGVGGIAQYLTNNADPTVDCIRWYDGDPTDTNITNPTLDGHKGWVNFSPPISNLNFSIDDLPSRQYYLIGARIVLPYKDRILFIGPVVQSSAPGSQVYLQDTVIYSQNGTPYYTCSFTGDPTLTTTVFTPILTPDNQTATANAYFEDVTGYGGFITAGFAQPIVSASTNEDVIILGFSNRQARMVYTGNDLVPFNIFVINSELGSSSTFSTVTFDRGVLSVGDHGIIISSQVSAQRVDLEIPDQLFEFNLENNGFERVSAHRDFINEWIYIAYLTNQDDVLISAFPNQTLQYNYRDNSWAIFNESYTTYGNFRKQTGYTWSTVGTVFPTWNSWNDPWNSGTSTLKQPVVIGGNQQGYVIERDDGTGELPSLTITNTRTDTGINSITAATNANPCVLTVPNTFVLGETVLIDGVTGMTQLNGNTYTVIAVTPSSITLNVNSTAFGVFIGPSGTVSSVYDVYSPNHCLNEGDYIYITNAIGTVGSVINNKIFSVSNPTINAFDLVYASSIVITGTYIGGGQITRMYVPFVQTKQFPVSWGMSKKTRIGPQQYLLTSTAAGEIELQIYLSQNASNPYNSPPIYPDPNAQNDSLTYRDTISTAPDNYIQSCNHIGLGNIGNGVSTSISLNLFTLFSIDNLIVSGSVFIQVGNIATFTDDGNGGFTTTGTGAAGSTIAYSTGNVVLNFTVAPTATPSFINFDYFYDNPLTPTASQQAQIWHRMNTSLLGDTVQIGFTMNDAQMRDPGFNNQFSEIELHAFILDVQPSQVLA